MAEIHSTTLTPTKLELLAHWLPRQSWYTGGSPAQLSRSGGFRLDDPGHEVGIEIFLVTSLEAGIERTYCVPMAYRAAPVAGSDAALIGTAEHGVLGPRWVYDGALDAVVSAQLVALLLGRAEPQQQSVSHTPDHSVTVTRSPLGGGPDIVATLVLHVVRQLVANPQDAAASPRSDAAASPRFDAAASRLPTVTAGWTLLDGTPRRAVIARLEAGSPAAQSPSVPGS